MTTEKIVDEIIVNLDFPKDNEKRSLFVVFSSKEPHIEIIIDNIERVMHDQYGFNVIRLNEALKSGDSQYGELGKLLSSCVFAIVILDGFRSNVLFEYGILKGLKKPSIVLLEDNATVDVKNYYDNANTITTPNPQINIDSHFSDVKDNYYIRYNKLDPKGFREIINKEYQKLREEIEKEFIHIMFPEREDIISTLRSELTTLAAICMKDDKELISSDEDKLKRVTAKIQEISDKKSISLPLRYFLTVAQVYEALNKNDVALELIEPHITKSKMMWHVLAFKAHLLRKLDRLEEALSVIEIAISYRPKNESLWHNKAILLERLGKRKEALSAYKVGVELESGCSSIHYNYGIMLYESNKIKESLKQFDLALQHSSNNSSYTLWKAKALYRLNEQSAAFKLAEKAANIKPNNADAWYTLGHWENDKIKALTYFDNAIKANPDHCGALCSKSAILSNTGKFIEAFEMMWEIRSKCTKYKKGSCKRLTNNLLTTICNMKKKPPEDKLIELFATIKGNDPKTIAMQALAYRAQNKYDESLKLFKLATSKMPNDANVWYNQACVYALTNNKINALKSLKASFQLSSSFASVALEDNDFKKYLNDSEFKSLCSNYIEKKIVNIKKQSRQKSRQKRQPTAAARLR